MPTIRSIACLSLVSMMAAACGGPDSYGGYYDSLGNFHESTYMFSPKV